MKDDEWEGPEVTESQRLAAKAGLFRRTSDDAADEAARLERASLRANYRENPGDWIERLLKRCELLEKRLDRLEPHNQAAMSPKPFHG